MPLDSSLDDGACWIDPEADGFAFPPDLPCFESADLLALLRPDGLEDAGLELRGSSGEKHGVDALCCTPLGDTALALLTPPCKQVQGDMRVSAAYVMPRYAFKQLSDAFVMISQQRVFCSGQKI